MKQSVWIHTLEMIEPEYEYWKKVLEYHLILKAIKEYNIVSIIRKFDDQLHLDDKEYIEEINSELKRWKGVERIASNIWAFETEKDADKFITYFNLRWQK